MSWGYKILFVYLAFVAGIAIMVIKSSHEKIDLVTQDYYAKELKYQDRINALQRTQALSSKVQYTIENNRLIVVLPAEFESKAVTGNALLYYAADESRDLTKDFTCTNRKTTIDLTGTVKGSYHLQVGWVSDGQAYYFEENIFL